MHFLLYTSDREHGGHLTLGIFNTEDEAWEYYNITHEDSNDRYYRIPHIEQWEGSVKWKEV